MAQGRRKPAAVAWRLPEDRRPRRPRRNDLDRYSGLQPHRVGVVQREREGVGKGDVLDGPTGASGFVEGDIDETERNRADPGRAQVALCRRVDLPPID